MSHSLTTSRQTTDGWQIYKAIFDFYKPIANQVAPSLCIHNEHIRFIASLCELLYVILFHVAGDALVNV